MSLIIQEIHHTYMHVLNVSDFFAAVLVTGASGFVATHVVQQLLQQGYHVRGTVRSLDNEVKVKPLRELCPEAAHALELVEADLLIPETWDK